MLNNDDFDVYDYVPNRVGVTYAPPSISIG